MQKKGKLLKKTRRKKHELLNPVYDQLITECMMYDMTMMNKDHDHFSDFWASGVSYCLQKKILGTTHSGSLKSL